MRKDYIPLVNLFALVFIYSLRGKGVNAWSQLIYWHKKSRQYQQNQDTPDENIKIIQ